MDKPAINRPSQKQSERPPEEQLRRHRERVGVRAQTILSAFWRDDLTVIEQTLQIEGWIDVLEDLTEEEIRKAWASYQRSGPRSVKGQLIKPDAGAIYRLAMKARPPKVQATHSHDDARPPRMTKEMARSILEDAGVKLIDNQVVALNTPVNINLMQEEAAKICGAYGITLADIRAADRSARLARPRQHLMYNLCRQGLTYSEIGRFLSRDHTTVMHGESAHAARLAATEKKPE